MYGLNIGEEVQAGWRVHQMKDTEDIESAVNSLFIVHNVILFKKFTNIVYRCSVKRDALLRKSPFFSIHLLSLLS